MFVLYVSFWVKGETQNLWMRFIQLLLSVITKLKLLFETAICYKAYLLGLVISHY